MCYMSGSDLSSKFVVASLTIWNGEGEEKLILWFANNGYRAAPARTGYLV